MESDTTFNKIEQLKFEGQMQGFIGGMLANGKTIDNRFREDVKEILRGICKLLPH